MNTIVDTFSSLILQYNIFSIMNEYNSLIMNTIVDTLSSLILQYNIFSIMNEYNCWYFVQLDFTI